MISYSVAFRFGLHTSRAGPSHHSAFLPMSFLSFPHIKHVHIEV